jgi:probable O-glycosylation ligase (exosortase A-associated)
MSEYLIALTFLFMYAFGFVAPFVFTLVYEWTDLFYPQMVAPALLGALPLSMICALSAFGFYLMDRRAPPRFNLRIALTFALALWVTLTTTWAEAPDAAWFKWNWAFKTVLFAAFIPFSIRSRVQIEAFLLVYLASCAAHLLPIGLKTMAGGGGYNVNLTLLGVNQSAWSESSMASAVCILSMPLLLSVARHSVLLPYDRLRKFAAIGVALAYVPAAIGTFARTAIIGFAVMGTGLWLRTRRKVVGMIIGGVVLAGATVFMSAQWESRISTIQDYQSENSAFVRILVWKWTLGYVADHPLGGGFNVYYINDIVIPAADSSAEPIVQHGRAFHSLYFEWLGEHGWPGLAMFLVLVGSCLLSLQRTIRRTRDHAELAWCNDYAKSLQLAIVVIMACGAFIGIGFQAAVWDLLSLSICLAEYARRALAKPAETVVVPWHAGAGEAGVAAAGHAVKIH